MSMQTPTGYKDGAWELQGQQLICTLGQTPWILNAMDIEYMQMQHGADFTILWLKARAVEQPYQIGRYPRNVYSFANALSTYAAKYGIPVYNSQIGSETQDRVQQTQTAVQSAPYPQQAAQQQPYPQQPYPQQATQQQSYPQQPYPQQGYPQQPYPQQCAQQQPYPQQPYPQQARMGGRPPVQPPRAARGKKKGNGKLALVGFLLIVIAVVIASSSADKSGSFPLVVIGIILLVLGSKSGRSRRGGHSGYHHDNVFSDNHMHTIGFVDRDNDGIDDRYDSFVDADGDGNDDNDSDSDSDDSSDD